jgi:hypothetical protein
MLFLEVLVGVVVAGARAPEVLVVVAEVLVVVAGV